LPPSVATLRIGGEATAQAARHHGPALRDTRIAGDRGERRARADDERTVVVDAEPVELRDAPQRDEARRLQQPAGLEPKMAIVVVSVRKY
jgi:hypothetical protein